MKEVFKAIYDFVMDQFTLFDNPVWNYIAIAIVGIKAFGIAWNVVGSLYNSGDIQGGCIGSVIHWVIRILVAGILFVVLSMILAAIRFLLSIPGWVWIAVLLGIAILLLVALIVKRKRQKDNVEK